MVVSTGQEEERMAHIMLFEMVHGLVVVPLGNIEKTKSRTRAKNSLKLNLGAPGRSHIAGVLQMYHPFGIPFSHLVYQ